jgi:hypothetical protein
LTAQEKPKSIERGRACKRWSSPHQQENEGIIRGTKLMHENRLIEGSG